MFVYYLHFRKLDRLFCSSRILKLWNNCDGSEQLNTVTYLFDANHHYIIHLSCGFYCLSTTEPLPPPASLEWAPIASVLPYLLSDETNDTIYMKDVRWCAGSVSPLCPSTLRLPRLTAVNKTLRYVVVLVTVCDWMIHCFVVLFLSLIWHKTWDKILLICISWSKSWKILCKIFAIIRTIAECVVSRHMPNKYRDC